MTSFLRGAPPPKNNPGSAPADIRQFQLSEIDLKLSKISRHSFFDLLFNNNLVLTVLNHIESKKKEKGNLNRDIALNGSEMS